MSERVTIIIPAFNAEKTIERCLDSVLSQTMSDFCVYAVDDCSKDNTLKILQLFSQKDERIHVVHLDQNRGPSYARNVALDAARGEWIAFVDSDDYIEEDFIEQMLEKGEGSKETDIVISSLIQVDQRGNILKEYPAHKEYEANTSEEALGIAYGQRDDLDFVYNLCCNKLYRRKLFRNIRFPLGRLQEDAYVMPYLLYNAQSVRCAEKAVYYYVDNHGSVSYAAQQGISDVRRRKDLLFLYENHIELYKMRKNKLYQRSQINYMHNVIAIYRLHYKNLNSHYCEEFSEIHRGFISHMKDMVGNPYCSAKLFISFMLFAVSPSVYLKMF